MIENSASNGVVWDPKADEKIVQIAKQLKKQEKQTENIGRLCNEIIELQEGKGGRKHGDKTFEKIARDPRIARNERQLRRYWHYYRLLKVAPYKDIDVVQKLKDKKSTIYQLARIMQEKDLDEKSKIDLISKCGQEALDNKLLVTQAEDMVTNEINNRLAQGSTQKSKPIQKKSKNLIPLEAINKFASSLEKQFVENQKLDKPHDYSVQEINIFAKLLNVTVDYVEVIMAHKSKAEIIAYLKPIAERLSKMTELNNNKV